MIFLKKKYYGNITKELQYLLIKRWVFRKQIFRKAIQIIGEPLQFNKYFPSIEEIIK